LGSRKKRKITR